MNPITALLSALGALTVVYVGGWAREIAKVRRAPDAGRTPATDARAPSPFQIGLGFFANFFDALGIGSFATTTAVFRLRRMVPDRVIPGTLNAGHALPTITQAFIFTAVIPVDVMTLITMIIAAVLGAWLGAGVVAHWPKRKVQVGMALALLAAAGFMFMRQLELFPTGITTTEQRVAAGTREITLPDPMLMPVRVWERTPGTDEPFVEMEEWRAEPAAAPEGRLGGWLWRDNRMVLAGTDVDREIRIDAAEIGVRGIRLALAIVGNFLLGALMTLGIGLYAPCMILVAMLGMSEKTAFPIMMGSCAFLMPIGSLRFIRERAYDLRNALGLAAGGIFGSFIAGVVVKSLPLYAVRWLVIVVVIYTAATLLLAASTERGEDLPEKSAVKA